MSVPTPSIIDTRRHQMFPTLAPAEIERLRRFGVLRSYGTGEALVRVGEVGQGLTIIWQARSKSPSAINRDAASLSSLTRPVRSWASWPNCRGGRRWSMPMRRARWKLDHRARPPSGVARGGGGGR